MFYRLEKDGVTFFIRLTPKAARDEFSGIETLADGKTYLMVRLCAVPEDGKANKALLKFLGKKLKIPLSRVSLEMGATSRIKQVKIIGEGEEIIAAFKKGASL